MKGWLERHLWAPIGGLYLFVALSGVTMLFHFYPLGIWGSHGMVGGVLAAVSVILACRYWSLVWPHLGPMAIFSLAAFLIAFGVRVALVRPKPAAPPTNSTQQILFALTRMPLDQFAPIFGGDPDRVAARLREIGFNVASNRQSIREIVRGSGRSEREALAALTDLLWPEEIRQEKPTR